MPTLYRQISIKGGYLKIKALKDNLEDGQRVLLNDTSALFFRDMSKIHSEVEYQEPPRNQFKVFAPGVGILEGKFSTQKKGLGKVVENRSELEKRFKLPPNEISLPVRDAILFFHKLRQGAVTLTEFILSFKKKCDESIPMETMITALREIGVVEEDPILGERTYPFLGMGDIMLFETGFDYFVKKLKKEDRRFISEVIANDGLRRKFIQKILLSN